MSPRRAGRVTSRITSVALTTALAVGVVGAGAVVASTGGHRESQVGAGIAAGQDGFRWDGFRWD